MALELEEVGRGEVATWGGALVRDLPALEPVPVDALHVTLAFLGRRSEAEVEAIATGVAAGAEGLEAPRLVPVGVRGVPSRAPRLWALEVEDEGGRAARVQRAVAGALVAADLHEPERRPFWPHLTIARVRGRGGTPQPPRPIERPPDAFVTPRVVLYRSRLSPGGARYEALTAVGLA